MTVATISIDLNDVAVAYRGVPVLQGVTATIEQGEFIAVIGPNGAGKSSLLRSIVGVTPHSGTVAVNDGGVSTTAHRRRAHDSPGRAVVDDVGGLGRGEVGVDRHVVQAGTPGRPHHRVVVLVVLHEDRHGVALTKSVGAQEMRQLICALFHLTEGDDGAGRIHDDGRLVRGGFGMLADLHALDTTTVRPGLR